LKKMRRAQYGRRLHRFDIVVEMKVLPAVDVIGMSRSWIYTIFRIPVLHHRYFVIVVVVGSNECV
jgi:hypothetical protein